MDYVLGLESEEPADVHLEGRPAARQTAAWRFEIGQCVTHKNVRLQSLVVGRVHASNGMEFYTLRSYAAKDYIRDRIILGDELKFSVPRSVDCEGCLLLANNKCPGLR